MNTNKPVVNAYPISNYTFRAKPPKPEKDRSIVDRVARYKRMYPNKEIRRSVEGVLLVQEHNFPHVLLLESGGKYCELPGGKLRPGENEIECLQRKLLSKLGPDHPDVPPNWQIKECLGVWWRPHFDTVLYPYCPTHITNPKECKTIYLVEMPENGCFAVPKNFKVLAVALFELYYNVHNYGPVISSIPEQLSRFRIHRVNP